MSKTVEHLDEVTVRFAGDSGDGMQLIGTQFSDTSGFAGNEVNTFPDYPSEIRAPEGTLYGVSAFQVHFGIYIALDVILVDVFQVGRFSAPSRAVIYDFCQNFVFLGIYKCHP